MVLRSTCSQAYSGVVLDLVSAGGPDLVQVGRVADGQAGGAGDGVDLTLLQGSDDGLGLSIEAVDDGVDLGVAERVGLGRLDQGDFLARLPFLNLKGAVAQWLAGVRRSCPGPWPGSCPGRARDTRR